jgi:hypothetical protein
MRRFKVEIEVTQRGEILDTKNMIIDSGREPQVGETSTKLVHPPIHETITKVEEIKLTKKT